MNVCIVTPLDSSFGYSDKNLWSTINYFQNKGHTVKVVLAKDNGFLSKKLAENSIEFKLIKDVEWWLSLPWENETYIETKRNRVHIVSLEIAHVLRQWKTDLVITNTALINVGFIASKILNIPHIWLTNSVFYSHPILKPVYSIKHTQELLQTPNNFILTNNSHFLNDLKQNKNVYTIRKVLFEKEKGENNFKVDIVIPFYNDKNIINCLDSIKNSDCKQINKVIVISDKGPDESLNKKVREYIQQDSFFEYLENKENKGFVFTCNVGMNYSQHDVILLNSDTIVTKGFADKLSYIAQLNNDTATVTPISNSAVQFSVPNIDTNNSDSTPHKTNDIITRMFNKFSYIETYSAHGFCMYIKRKIINEIGTFDYENFKEGYGEENDYSLRCLRAGFKNMLALNTYIYHIHGQSFGDERKKKIKKERAKRIRELYPELEDLNIDFSKINPLIEIGRILAFLKEFVQKKDKVVLISGQNLDLNINNEFITTLLSKNNFDKVILEGTLANSSDQDWILKAVDSQNANKVKYLGYLDNIMPVINFCNLVINLNDYRIKEYIINSIANEKRILVNDSLKDSIPSLFTQTGNVLFFDFNRSINVSNLLPWYPNDNSDLKTKLIITFNEENSLQTNFDNILKSISYSKQKFNKFFYLKIIPLIFQRKMLKLYKAYLLRIIERNHYLFALWVKYNKLKKRYRKFRRKFRLQKYIKDKILRLINIFRKSRKKFHLQKYIKGKMLSLKKTYKKILKKASLFKKN